MTEETLFTPEEEQRINGILLVALRIEEERARELFIREQCGNNHRMLDRVRADIREAIGGEDAQPSPILKEGEEIGNYRIVEKIKQGGFATVYSAEHKISRTFAAIKIFDKPIRETDKDIIWNKEGKSLSKLDHDNIVKFYDLGFYEKGGERLPYVIVELVKGKHLDEHCIEKDPSVRDVLSLFRSLCSVIEYIHGKKNIFHLDLKPSNILVTASRPYRIKLIDFGSSRLFRNEPRRLTRNDFINILTIKFASPEQLGKDEEIDHQSDIYSLGAVLYLLLTEKVPLGEGKTEKEEIKREVTNMNLSPALPSNRVLEIKKEIKFGLSIKNLSKAMKGDLDFIIMKCLEKRRRNRYETVSEIIQDIDRFLKGKPLRTRHKPFGYKPYKLVSQLFGFRGGFSGWSGWKIPLQRFAIFGVLLIIIGFMGGEAYRHFRPRQISKRIEPRKIKLNIRKDDGIIQDQEFDSLALFCDDRLFFTFIEIPKGEFLWGRHNNELLGMSSEEEKNNKEERDVNFLKPQQVSISQFYMGRFEVTNKQWNIVVKMPEIRMSLEPSTGNESYPKINVSYAQVMEFCARLSSNLKSPEGKEVIIRLPSETEWEYACRASKDINNFNKRFGGGDKFDQHFINAKYIPTDDPEPVPEYAKTLLNRVQIGPLADTNFAANPFGLTAMNGNVWEIVGDSWHDQKDEKGRPTDNSFWEPLDPLQQNPDKYYVLRGGSFDDFAFRCQCFYRTKGSFTSNGNERTGFRVVLIEK